MQESGPFFETIIDFAFFLPCNYVEKYDKYNGKINKDKFIEVFHAVLYFYFHFLM